MLKRIKASFFADSIAHLAQRLRMCTRTAVLAEHPPRLQRKLFGAPANMLAFERDHSNNKCNTALFRSFDTPSVSQRSAAKKIRGNIR
jgi:hypothetical protein